MSINYASYGSGWTGVSGPTIPDIYEAQRDLKAAKRWNALEPAITEYIQKYVQEKTTYGKEKAGALRELVAKEYPEYLGIVDKYIVLM
jgi:hypothetical protein